MITIDLYEVEGTYSLWSDHKAREKFSNFFCANSIEEATEMAKAYHPDCDAKVDSARLVATKVVMKDMK